MKDTFLLGVEVQERSVEVAVVTHFLIFLLTGASCFLWGSL